MERPRCETCPYFDAESAVDADGECRRHAPAPLTLQCGQRDGWLSQWPEVYGDDWCSEHPAFGEFLADRELAEGGETG